ncbi:MAG: hypothetical protein ACYTF7_09535, partial [Planctomycetota bacterium]
LFHIIQNSRHEHSDTNEATWHLFWRIHNSYNSVRFLQASDPRTFSLVDQYTIVRCMYEALLSLEHICHTSPEQTRQRATQYILHINVLLERDLLKNIPSLQPTLRDRMMSFFSSHNDGDIIHKANTWRHNNKEMNTFARHQRTWHGRARLADIALHHDEQYFMHTIFHHAVHTNYVSLSQGAYTPDEMSNITIMIFARSFNALLTLYELKAPYNDKPALKNLCRPIDEIHNQSDPE